jgi:cytochrome c oxidase subunit 3
MSEINKAEALRLGLFVFALLAVLTAAEFGIAVTIGQWFLLALVAVIKAGLVLYYYMHIYRLFEPDQDPDRESYAYKLVTSRLGLWMFIVSDTFIFGGLFLSRLNLLGLTRPDVNQLLGLGVTSVLLLSSFFANRAETSMAHGDRRQFYLNTSFTIFLGLLFLAGVIGIEWRTAPFGPGDGVQGAVFFSMTGYHAFHVLTGVIFLILVLRNGLRGGYSIERHWGVEAAVVYWHFVDVVWVFFYPALYLLGTVQKF